MRKLKDPHDTLMNGGRWSSAPTFLLALVSKCDFSFRKIRTKMCPLFINILVDAVFIKPFKEVTIHFSCLFLGMLYNSLIANAWRMKLL